MNNRKQRYKQLCAQEPSIPIFSQGWWLDATAGSENWDVALVETNEDITACLPYVYKKRAGFTISTVPMLTYCLGPWMRPFDAKHATQISRQKDALEKLIELLPPFDHFKQRWHYTLTNWLPFFWHGFNQTTNYTYLLPLQSEEASLWQGLQENVRREIRKATSRSGLQVHNDLPVSSFIPLNQLVYERQGISPPYSEELINTVDEVCTRQNCRKIFIAQDAQGTAHAGVYLIWDENSAYYLMGGSDPAFRNSGAMSLCMWEAIKFASTVTKSFDFCGSMIEPIERFIRAFGGVQTPYFSISRTPSRLVATLLFTQSLTHSFKARQ
ncbi:GNAT family N-acetyltransferase [Alcaligenaceae bacterium]|nr:GNAT family N-acetyltransferase [Alcaligenaceae bacterium]